jgi:hypothetical protein
MSMGRAVLLLSAMLAVAGCSQTVAWNKPGASQAEFNNERYRCMQEAQQQSSSAYVNRYGGVASSGQTTNEPLFNACMNAKGWYLQKDTGGEGKATAQSIMDRASAVCADRKYALYFSKTACKADEITLQQMDDPTRVTPEEKPVVSEVLAQLNQASLQWADALRKYGGSNGAKRSDVFLNTLNTQTRPNHEALYSGEITWGEYNKRRVRNHRDWQALDRQLTGASS